VRKQSFTTANEFSSFLNSYGWGGKVEIHPKAGFSCGMRSNINFSSLLLHPMGNLKMNEIKMMKILLQITI
jgi:hypothetical protein